MTYLACSFAKPLWASIEELSPGNKVESRFSKKASMSVASASLWQVLEPVLNKCQTGVVHFSCVCALMRHNNRFLGRWKANIPFETQLMITMAMWSSVRARTKLDARSITSGCSRNEVWICGTVGYSIRNGDNGLLEYYQPFMVSNTTYSHNSSWSWYLASSKQCSQNWWMAGKP